LTSQQRQSNTMANTTGNESAATSLSDTVTAVRDEIWDVRSGSKCSITKDRDTRSADSPRNSATDRRGRNEAAQARRQEQRQKGGILHAGFAQDEIAAEDRRPKRKVAVMIGYSGTGYKGMQMYAPRLSCCYKVRIYELIESQLSK